MSTLTDDRVVYGVRAADGPIVYVGLTTRGADFRLRCHKSHARRGKIVRPFYQWLAEHLDAEAVVLERCGADDELEIAERRWIASLPGLLNQTVGGNRGTRHSPETIEKMRASHKPMTAEHKAKVADSNRKTWTGRSHTDESREKIRAARLRQINQPVMSEEGRRRVSESRRAYWEAWRAERGRT